MLGVFEALMAYTISSWTKDTSAEKAQKLNSLFKGYRRVAEFAKVMNGAISPLFQYVFN
jgi:Ser/Thr protein kinase RdoA (MazF antagonist)